MNGIRSRDELLSLDESGQGPVLLSWSQSVRVGVTSHVARPAARGVGMVHRRDQRSCHVEARTEIGSAS